MSTIFYILIATNIASLLSVLYVFYLYSQEKKRIKNLFRSLRDIFMDIHKQYEPFGELEPLSINLLETLIKTFDYLSSDSPHTEDKINKNPNELKN